MSTESSLPHFDAPTLALARCLAEALQDDPFYRAITAPDQTRSSSESSLRLQQLCQYFAYSLVEGQALGFITTPAATEPLIGAAVWLQPQPQLTTAAALAFTPARKIAFLATVLPARGLAHYQAILQNMAPPAEAVIAAEAWYLSILGVTPLAQGQGWGQQLMEQGLSHVEQARAACYLETFSPRNIPFYQRLGFSIRHAYLEPITQATCWIMTFTPAPQQLQTNHAE